MAAADGSVTGVVDAFSGSSVANHVVSSVLVFP